MRSTQKEGTPARQTERLAAMGELTAGVAHQMNNLLVPILAAFDMLSRPGISPNRTLVLTERGIAAVNSAASLVQQLLAFSGRQRLHSSAVDIGGLVSTMAERIRHIVGSRVAVLLNIQQDLEPAYADPAQLETAILQLTSNARHAMPDGGVLRITVSAETRALVRDVWGTLRPCVRISIEDNGIGMDEMTRHRAVEPFFSTRRTGEGRGLGLSMAHGVAAQLGGHLTVTSELGVGTNVEVFLPLAGMPPTAETLKGAHCPAGTVLLVDDDPMVRSSTSDMLLELGFDVQEASSAEEAWGLIERGDHLDLLITDHLMSGDMNGVDLAFAVRQRRPQLAVLIISGFAEVGAIAADLPLLAKPFRQMDLAARIATLKLF